MLLLSGVACTSSNPPIKKAAPATPEYFFEPYFTTFLDSITAINPNLKQFTVTSDTINASPLTIQYTTKVGIFANVYQMNLDQDPALEWLAIIAMDESIWGSLYILSAWDVSEEGAHFLGQEEQPHSFLQLTSLPHSQDQTTPHWMIEASVDVTSAYTGSLKSYWRLQEQQLEIWKEDKSQVQLIVD